MTWWADFLYTRWTLFVDNHSIHLRFPKLEIGKVHKVQGPNRSGSMDGIIHILLFQSPDEEILFSTSFILVFYFLWMGTGPLATALIS